MDEYVPCTRCESGAHDRVVILPYSETPTKKGLTMKNFWDKTEKFLDDHDEAIFAGCAGLVLGTYIMYFAAVHDVRAVQAVAAKAWLEDNDSKMLVKVYLNNGAWTKFTWITDPTK